MDVGHASWSPDYIKTVVATVRQHEGASNAWPQWANALADEVVRLEKALVSLHLMVKRRDHKIEELIAEVKRLNAEATSHTKTSKEARD